MKSVGSGTFITLGPLGEAKPTSSSMIKSMILRRGFFRKWNSLPRIVRTTCLPVLGMLFCVGFILVIWSSRPSLEDEPVFIKSVTKGAKVPDVMNVVPAWNDDKTADYQAEHGQILPPRPPLPNALVEERIPAEKDIPAEVKVDDKSSYDHEAFRKEHFPLGVSFSGPRNGRQKAVVESFLHAWKNYKTYAWGQDHLKPISKSYANWFGLGLTIVDSLDTLYIMNLLDEFKEARDWIRDSLVIGVKKEVNLFETTIRVMGGLLSAFHLSRDDVFLTKAEDLGERLFVAFNSPSGIPYSDVNLFLRTAKSPAWSPDSSTSEVTTVQLEFRDLSRITGNPKFEIAAAKVNEIIHDIPKPDGLVPIYISPRTGRFRPRSTKTLGARGDSYYEYLLKQWIQTGKTKDYLLKDFEEAMDGVITHLVRRTASKKLMFIGEIRDDRSFNPKMDHLTCYLPGTIMYGIHHGLSKRFLEFAEEIMYTCYQTYVMNPSFLAAELTHFNVETSPREDMYVNINDSHNLLRPETIESLFYMYYFTGNTTYQEWGWEIYQAFEKYARVTDGYSSIGNVRNIATMRHLDMMESFFLGETLKYFYLLFGEDALNGSPDLSMDDWVINTEAHPLPIYNN